MPQIIQRSFTSGEIAPGLQARADLTKYMTGLNLCENMFVRAQGGVYSRPGFRFVGEIGDSSRVARLIPFSFNTEQTYVLLFEHMKIRVIRDGGFVLDDLGDIFELATPYTEEELYTLGFTQSADVMTIVHHNHNPANLSRSADNVWAIDDIVFASTVTAPVISTIVATGDGAGTYSKTYGYVVTTVNTDGVESLASARESISTPSLAVTAGVKLTWGAVADVDYYRIYKDTSGESETYGWIGDSKTLNFTDFNLAPITSDAPPEDRQPFAEDGDKPSTVAYYQQRQMFANTINEPQAVFTSRTGNSSSLRTSNPARDDDAITFTIAAQQVNEIRHLLPLDTLLMLTSGGEWILTEGSDRVLTPATVGVRIQSYNGCSIVPPVVINSTALFLQEKGARLRDLGYQFSSDTYTGNDLSLMAEHLFEGRQIVSMAYAAEPYGIVWCVRDDGVMIALTYQREHQVWGWHRHTTQGSFESVTTINEEDRDTVYVVIKRNINGVDVRYVEKLEYREATNAVDCFYVDSGLSYDGEPVSSISGLGHLENETVVVLADGYVIPDQVVTEGVITVPYPASKIHVGLQYVPVIETLDIDTPSPTQTVKANSVSVSKVVLEVQSTRGGFVGPRQDSTSASPIDMTEIKPRRDSDGYNPIALKTFKEEVIIQPMWSKGGGLRIEQRAPLPMAILAVIPQVDIGGN